MSLLSECTVEITSKGRFIGWVGSTYVGMVLEKSAGAAYRVMPQAHVVDGGVQWVNVVERRLRGGWKQASDTWQELVLWEGVDGVALAVQQSGAAFVM